MTSGRACTWGVVGVNCSSSNISWRSTTWPGEVAMVSPTLNGVASTIDGIMWLCRMSWTRFFSPLTRLSPPPSGTHANRVGGGTIPSTPAPGARRRAAWSP